MISRSVVSSWLILLHLVTTLLPCSFLVDAFSSPLIPIRIGCPPSWKFGVAQSVAPYTPTTTSSSTRIGSVLHMSADDEALDNKEGGEEPTNSLVHVDEVSITDEPSRLQKIRQRFFPSTQQAQPKSEDGLTFRQKLAKLGLSVALSYGWVSNVSYSVTVSLAWYIFSKRTGMSPLAPGQWKGFLAVYAGFYVFNNIVRPLRLALSVSVSIYFERAVAFIQETFKVNKGVAIGLTVFFANVVGTITLMCLGISVAATAAGVPVFAK